MPRVPAILPITSADIITAVWGSPQTNMPLKQTMDYARSTYSSYFDPIYDNNYYAPINSALRFRNFGPLPTTPVLEVVTQTVGNSLYLSWSQSIYPAGISHYDIYKDNQFLISTSQLNYLDDAVISGQSYSYKVKAITNEQYISSFSNVVIISALYDVYFTITRVSAWYALFSGNHCEIDISYHNRLLNSVSVNIRNFHQANYDGLWWGNHTILPGNGIINLSNDSAYSFWNATSAGFEFIINNATNIHTPAGYILEPYYG